MKRGGLAIAVAILIVAAGAVLPGRAQKKTAMFGVAFYNLENLFDTINNNGTQCREYFTGS